MFSVSSSQLKSASHSKKRTSQQRKGSKKSRTTRVKGMERFRMSMSLSKKSAVLKKTNKFDKNIGEIESVSEINKRNQEKASQNPMIQSILNMIQKIKL